MSAPRQKPGILQPTSDEQNVIIQHMLDGHNVSVDACAGSGKSTTILSLVQRMFGHRFVVITYNKMLRVDAKEKIRDLGLTNVEVHTFHSLAVKYYLSEAHTDCGIRKIILRNTAPRQPIPTFHVLVLDEAQDISMLYFQLAAKFVADMKRSVQLFVLGDYMQCLYDFKGADIRFLTQYSRIWQSHPLLTSPEYKECTLRTSYRITNEIAGFVNDAMLGTERLVACKTDYPVMYICNTPKNIENTVVFNIRQILESGESPDDIFVLGASARGPSMRKMENILVERGIPCHVPIFETEEVDEKVIKGKIVFSTFHSVKGRQRKYVFITGFDQSYFEYYAKNLDANTCPNTLYVGTTRAIRRLFLLETTGNKNDRPLSFLHLSHSEMKQRPYIDFRGIPKNIVFADQLSASPEEEDDMPIKKEPDGLYYITPTSLIRFIPETTLMKLAPLIDDLFITETPELSPDSEIKIPNVVETSSGFCEEISDLNGIAIPSIYYDHVLSKYTRQPARRREDEAQEETHSRNGSAILYDIVADMLAETRDNEHRFLKTMFASLPTTCESPADYLFLANIYVAVKEKVYFKLNQIGRNDYTWLSPTMIRETNQRLDKIVGAECRSQPPLIEHSIITYSESGDTDKINAVLAPYFPGKTFRFSARADLITERCIWELKCTSMLTMEHKLQVIIYDWLWRIVANTTADQKRKTNKCPLLRKAKLINVKTGEILRVDATFEQETEIVVELLKAKYVKEELKPDEELWEDCRAYIQTLASNLAMNEDPDVMETDAMDEDPEYCLGDDDAMDVDEIVSGEEIVLGESIYT